MSIHELYFDEQGNIAKTRCLDKEILAALEPDSEASDMTEGENRFPGLQDRAPIPVHDQTLNPEKLPHVIRKLSAISLTEVREEEFVLGHGDCGFTKMRAVNRVLTGEEINQANLRVGDLGLAYSETDVYVAPKTATP